MSFSPGVIEVAEPMLFGTPTCEVCGGELPARKGTGRKAKYCSKKCSSKADRARERDRRDKASAAADTPRGETRLPELLVDEPLAAELLGLGAQLDAQARELLLHLDRAVRGGDSALARQATDDARRAAHFLLQRHGELIEQLLAAHPACVRDSARQAPECEDSPRGETTAGGTAAVSAPGRAPTPPGNEPTAAWSVEPGQPRAGDPSATGAVTGDARDHVLEQRPAHPVSPRGDSQVVERSGIPAPAAPRGETAGLHAASGTGLRDLLDRTLAQQHAAPVAGAANERTITVPRDPTLRGLPHSTDIREPLDPAVFGYGWELVGWTVKPDVRLVIGQGRQIGWVEHGVDGGDGWVAVYEESFLGDPVTQRATLHTTAVDAAATIRHAYLANL